MFQRSKTFERVLRFLIGLLGAGVGAALTLAAVQLIKLANPDTVLPLAGLAIGYSGMCLLGFVFFLLGSRVIIRWTVRVGSAIVGYFDRLPVGQMLPAVFGLLIGLALAALVSSVLRFMGESIFTTAFSAILCLTLGLLGYTIGRRRSKDLLRLSMHMFGFRGKRVRRRHRSQAPDKLVDSSALADGRLVDVAAAGFLEGSLAVPDFIVNDLRRMSESADTVRSARGRRGLDSLEALKQKASLRVEAVEGVQDAEEEPEVRLLRMARERGCAIVTCDQGLARAAQISGVRAMNVNELASALRLVVSAGDVLSIAVVREGKEPGQGVGYLPDGTMAVIEGGRGHIGENVQATVTSVLQTGAGRMIFLRLQGD